MKSNIKKKLNRALAFEKNGKSHEAVQIYTSIIDEDNTCREAYINLGNIYNNAKKYAGAVRCYNSALKLQTDYLTYFNLGSVLYKVGEYKRSVINLEKSRNLNSSFPMTTLVMGLSFSRMNNVKAAETNFREVIKIWPENKVALTALSILCYNQERFNESLEFLNRILAIEDSNTRIRELKSNILYRTGKLQESADEIKSIKKISQSYKYYDEYIKSIPIEAYTDRYGPIDKKIQQLEAKSETDRESLISLSLCHLFIGDTDKAIDYLFKAKETSG